MAHDGIQSNVIRQNDPEGGNANPHNPSIFHQTVEVWYTIPATQICKQICSSPSRTRDTACQSWSWGQPG